MMIRRTCRRRGMAALQAVLLLGAGFLIVWGLMEIWNGSADPVGDSTRKILNGEVANGAPGGPPGGGGGPPGAGGGEPGGGEPGGPPPPPELPPAEEPPSTAAERLAQVAYELYFTNKRFQKQELEEIKQFLERSNEILDNPLTHLVLSEVNLRQGNHWDGFTHLLAALNPVEIVMGRIKMARQAANRLDLVKNVKKKPSLTAKKVLDEAEKNLSRRGGSYRELKKAVKDHLPENVRENIELHHIPPKSVNGVGGADGPAIVMWKDHHRALPTSRGPAGNGIRKEIDRLTKAGDRKGAFDLAVKEVRDLHGNAYDREIRQARDYARRMGWFD